MICWWGDWCLFGNDCRHHKLISGARELASSRVSLPYFFELGNALDKYEKATLWGKNLYTYLSDVYQNKARYCVMFLSRNYAAKLWTNHEREAAQARAFRENEEYILPIRLDDTDIPGILSTT